MPPLLVGWVIDSVSGHPPGWITWLVGPKAALTLALFLALAGFVIFALESLFQWMYQYGFMTLAQNVQHKLRLDAYTQLQTREYAYFENHRTGNTLSILNDDVNQLERFLNTAFNEIVHLIVLFVFAGVVMIGISWQLAVISLIPVPVIVLASLKYQSLISPKYEKVRASVGRLNSRLENNISGILVIKSFTAESFERDRVEEESNLYKSHNYNAIKLNALYVPLIRMAVALGFAAVLFLGSYWVLEGTGILTVGELVLFSMMIQRLLWPLTRLGNTIDDYERASASAKRIFNLLDTPSQIKNPEHPADSRDITGAIAFQNISFCYDNQIPILNNMNLSIQPGEKIGIAGVTGAGKSTFIKLLLRLYDPTQGSICLDNTDIKDMAIHDLRRHISLVSQDVYLFHGSIFENIAYGMPDVTLEDVESAAKKAELHDFVMSLPHTYQSIVGKRGIKLSGGQRQRLSIARAILKDAKIMIFDEATSSVDTETEKAIQTNIYKVTEKKTAIIIAHRLSTIRKADRIIVLKNGEIVEEGSHDTLINNNQTYASLWATQTGEL